jgi:hypothetical protein
MGFHRSSFARAGLVAVLASGCYSSGGRGKPPIDDEMYFPVAVSVTTSGNVLVVANSDFDLAYNSGTVQAYDLAAIDAAARACEATPVPAGCDGIEAKTYVKASVRVGAFASDMTIVPLYDLASGDAPTREKPVAGVSRALIPVRGDATLTYIDVRESTDATGKTNVTLDCYAGAGPSQLGNDCDANHRVGQVATADARQLTLEGEPFAIAVPSYWSCPAISGGKCSQEPARSNGVAGIVHQVSGDVSVFRNTQKNGEAPTLAYTLSGLPASGDAIAALDLEPTTSTESFVPRFLVANRSQASLLLTSYIGDDGNPDRSALVASSLIPISLQATGYDTRGILVDPPGAGESRPTRVFLSSRSPASLIVGHIDPVSGSLLFYENVPLPIGPSRITRSTFTDASGIARSRIYVASYDSAYVVAYDPDARRLGAVIKAGRGPYSIAIDATRKLGYMANFIDGTIQVIELDADKHPDWYEQVIFTMGKPQGPRS